MSSPSVFAVIVPLSAVQLPCLAPLHHIPQNSRAACSMVLPDHRPCSTRQALWPLHYQLDSHLEARHRSPCLQPFRLHLRHHHDIENARLLARDPSSISRAFEASLAPLRTQVYCQHPPYPKRSMPSHLQHGERPQQATLACRVRTPCPSLQNLDDLRRRTGGSLVWSYRHHRLGLLRLERGLKVSIAFLSHRQAQAPKAAHQRVASGLATDAQQYLPRPISDRSHRRPLAGPSTKMTCNPFSPSDRYVLIRAQTGIDRLDGLSSVKAAHRVSENVDPEAGELPRNGRTKSCLQ